MAKSALRRALDIIDGRDDIHILRADSEEIIGVHLRRVWEVSTVNPDGFNPVERQAWHYYGQAFTIIEKRTTREGEAPAEDRKYMADIARKGGLVILVDPDDPLEALMDYIGTQPENVGDYLKRSPR